MSYLRPDPRNCIWFKEQRVAFVYIPKTACTSWKLHLWRLSNGVKSERFLTYAEVHNRKIVELPYLDTMNLAEQDEFYRGINDKEIDIVCILREPRSRILSAYIDKVKEHKKKNSLFAKHVIPSIKKINNNEKDKRPTFYEFLKWVKSSENEFCDNEHWKPATRILGLRNYMFGVNHSNLKIWTMTNNEKAVELFNERFNKEFEFPTSQELGKRKVYKSESLMEEYFGEKEEELFNKIYGNDISIYNKIL